MRLATLALTVGLPLLACSGDSGGPAVASQLAFTVQPSNVTAGQTITPAVKVSVQDVSGNLVPEADNSITLTLAPSNGGATLSGTTTVNASAGVATFADLQVSKAGTNYTLNASAATLADATSAAFAAGAAPGVPTTISPVSGDGQSARVGQALAEEIAVRVTDGLNNPVAGVGVTFSVAPSGGSLSGADQATNGDGIATAGVWTLGTIPGPTTLLVASPGLEGSPLRFTATAIAGPAAALAAHAGDGQTTIVGTAVSERPTVLVTDSYGNPAPGVAVTFSVGSGGGSVTGEEQATGADGLATVGSWRLGDHSGSNTLQATSAGLSGSPVTFTATAVKGVVVEVRDNYFHSVRNGSGAPPHYPDDIFGQAAIDTIAVGESVTWMWVGRNHNVTSQFDPSGTHDAPHTFTLTIQGHGTYLYYCTNHSQVSRYFDLQGMIGRIVVR